MVLQGLPYHLIPLWTQGALCPYTHAKSAQVACLQLLPWKGRQRGAREDGKLFINWFVQPTHQWDLLGII
jgi:hypothetical protein